MIKKKVTVLLTSALLLTTLAACGQNEATVTKSSESATKTSKVSKKSSSSVKSASTSSSQKTASSQPTAKATKTTAKLSMDFDQIEAGNFSGLSGNWSQIGTGYNRHDQHGMRYKAGGDGQLSVSKSSITTGTDGITLHGHTLTANDLNHPVEYQVKNNVLTVLLKDDETSINWAVTFYPKGTTSEYRDDSHASKNTKNIIVVWTSNNFYTQIFAQSKKGTQISGIDLEQIQAENFSSLAGRWKNSAGKVITVTNKIVKKPAGSMIVSDKGVAISGPGHTDGSEVITSGQIKDGYIMGGYGSFKEQEFTPFAIVPRGVKVTKDDDSNVNQDRLINGGGESGYVSEAYYRE